MKRTYAMLVLMLFFSSSVFSQTKGDMEFSGSIGINYTTTITPLYYGYQPAYKIGLNVAASGDYFFSDRWSIKAKLIFDQKGWIDGPLYVDGNYYYDFRLNYLTIPVMANWHFGKKRNWYLNFGPYVGFLLNAKSADANADVTSSFSSSDVGLELGIGVKIPVNDRLKIFIEDDAQEGIGNIVKANSDGSSLQNLRGSISVGVNVNLKGRAIE